MQGVSRDILIRASKGDMGAFEKIRVFAFYRESFINITRAFSIYKISKGTIYFTLKKV